MSESVQVEVGPGPSAGDFGAGVQGGCCGSPARAERPTVEGSPCCGSVEQAEVEGACCGAKAKAGAVAAGAGCCG